MKIAIIDLGTNTCNLLIAEKRQEQFDILYQGKELVRLGDIQIKDNIISDAAIERVLQVLQSQKNIIDAKGVDKIKVIATSAVRAAKNKKEFLKIIVEKTGLPIQVISGEKEAGLIFKGVMMALDDLQDKSLILDIGGGSNELIIAHNQDILWKESKPTGMARIINKFIISDPIKPQEIQLLQNFFLARHQKAVLNCKKEGINTLIGCSGSFDTIADIIDQVSPGEKVRKLQKIPLPEFYRIYNLLIHSTRKQRMELKGMDSVRIDLIIPAIVLIDMIIKQVGIINLIQTGYALREGVLFGVMEKDLRTP